MKLQLDQNYSLSFEQHLKGVRIIIFDQGNEWVCRKESFKKLSRFLNMHDGHIFKGRLQLYKHGDDIAVEVKGNPVGKLPAEALKLSLRHYGVKM